MPKENSVATRLLVQWIDDDDMRALWADQDVELSTTVHEEIGMALMKPDQHRTSFSPVKSTVSERFDEVILISQYRKAWGEAFGRWAGEGVVVRTRTVKNPESISEVVGIAEDVLFDLRQREDWSEVELCLNISAGTRAMSSAMLLLGQTCHPAILYETIQGKTKSVELPYDLLSQVIPRLLRDTDDYLQDFEVRRTAEPVGFDFFAGTSEAIKAAVARAKNIAMYSVPVLLLGETGTGKKSMATAIHRSGPRYQKPLRQIDCAGLRDDQFEVNLLGRSDRKGQPAVIGELEAADGGTLFLNRVNELSLASQALLLSTLQQVDGKTSSFRQFSRTGEAKRRNADVRIITSSNIDIPSAVRQGLFLEDLHHRLSTLTITLPPLRERPADAVAIAANFLDEINLRFEAETPGYVRKKLSGSAKKLIRKHHWPGNARQLRQVLCQAAILSSKRLLMERQIVSSIGELDSGDPTDLTPISLEYGFNLKEHLDRIQRRYLEMAMKEAGGVKSKAAELLGYNNYQTLAAQLERLGVS